ncbi:hypothetical protein HII36_05830 [Nonomuraea sp. NN258]|uniref:DUF11 domain-containing protein n=1 Tax=Nonomuraea antri TaxID=2730852 RepID=UPI0015681B07|nr:DUF11 domain-containing protein [Nonomuraea antri]NRQ31358.1 hypothetical protein [Nonomuraea antri]
MRTPLSKTAVGALLAAAALIVPVIPAAAATTTTPIAASAVTAAAVQAEDPYSEFAVSVKAPKAVKAGRKITYKIDVENLGPHQADRYWLGGRLPKGIKSTVTWRAEEDTECFFDREGFWCWGPWVLEKGDTDWLDITVTLKPGTKGTVTATLGADVYDVPTGMENLDKEEIDRLGGFQTWFFAKKVKTKIVR